MILALDTTHEIGSLALVENGIILEEQVLSGGDGYGHLLFAAIESLSVPVQRIDAFAAACGPGTFTGVRIGLTAVKGFADALNKPAYGISNLTALSTFGSAPHVIPFYDARRGDVYARLLDGSEQVLPVPQLFSQIFTPVEWVSFDPWPGLQVTLAPRAIAGVIGRLAEERFNNGDRPDPASLDANYVRRTDAELNWRDANSA